MEKNKHILLFEAFAARSLSKLMNYLKTINKTEKAFFMKALKSLQLKYDFAISEITDEYFEYLNKSDGLLIRNTSKVENENGIFCFKFWFSQETGYLGYTYVGNVVKRNELKADDKIKFSDIESSDLGITSGNLKSIGSDLSELKTGDVVITQFESGDSLLKGTIIKEDKNYFVIQNRHQGNEPQAPDNTWKKYGRYSWTIGSETSRTHCKKLSLYTEGDTELTIDGVKKGETESKLDPMEYNLPMADKEVRSWDQRSDSISKKEFNLADFCIVFYYDKLCKTPTSKPSITRSKRVVSKSGATSFMKNEEILNANLSRYISKICKSLGIDYKREFSPRNLQKIVIKILNGNLAIPSILFGDTTGILSRSISELSYLINEYNRSDKPLGGRELERVKSYYENIKMRIDGLYREDNYINQKKLMSDLISKLDKENKQSTADLYRRILSIGNYIFNKLTENPINTMEDLRLIHIKIKSIKEVLQNEDLMLTSQLHQSLEAFRYGLSDVYCYAKRIEGYDDRMSENNKKIDTIEKYIKSIL